MPDASRERSHPPSVERVLAAARARVADRDAEAVLAVARDVVDDERVRLERGETGRSVEALADAVIAALEEFDGPDMSGDGANAPGSRVINATGVLVHTNLGRAPLSDAAIARVVEVGAGYSNSSLSSTRRPVGAGAGFGSARSISSR